MICVCTGKSVIYGGSHVYAGDEFRCSGCGATVVNTSATSFESPEELQKKGASKCLVMPQ